MKMDDSIFQRMKARLDEEMQFYSVNVFDVEILVVNEHGGNKSISTRYIPEDEVAGILFDLSLTRYLSEFKIHHMPLRLMIAMSPSIDGGTNIDADMIDYIVGLKMKKGVVRWKS